MHRLLQIGLYALAGLCSAALTAQTCGDESALNDLSKYNSYGPVTQATVADAAALCDDAFAVSLSTVQTGSYDAGFQLLESESPPDEAGKKWTFSFRYRAAAERTFNFLLNSRKFGTYGDGGDHTYSARTLTATTEWKTFTTDFTSVRSASDAADDWRFYLLWAVGESTDDLFIDGIRFTEDVPSHTVPGTFYVSPDGSDANDGTSWELARRTLRAALADLIAGDELVIDDGIYVENNLKVLGLVGTADRPTVIRARNQWGAKITSDQQYNVHLKIESSEHVVVDGLEVYSTGTTRETNLHSGIESFGSNYVTVRNSFSHDCGCGGFGARDGDYITFERNVARDNAKISEYNCSGLSIYQPKQLDDAPGYHIIIRDNVLFENECRVPFSIFGFTVPTDGNGIILDDFNNTQDLNGDGIRNPPFLAETLIENNLVFSNGGSGIKTYETENVTIRNNTVWHNNYVIEEIRPSIGEIAAEVLGGEMKVYNNIAVKAFGQDGNAFFVQKLDGASVETRNNVFVGNVNDGGGVTDRAGDQEVSEDQQSYVKFAQQVPETIDATEFGTVDDFRQWFGLRAESPALNAGDNALAPADDLTGISRPQDGDRVDIGCYEGITEAVGPLPDDLTLNAEIQSTPEPITIDGDREGFFTSARQAMTKSLLGNVLAKADLSAAWWAVYDADNLYVAVEVTDDVLQSDSGDGAADDAVNIFIDGGNEKGGSYDANDLHLRVAYGDGGQVVEVGSGVAAGVDGAVFTTADGYSVEVAIPWSVIGVSAADGLTVGIDVIANDDDDGGADLEDVLAWQSTTAGAESDPSKFGEGTLTTVPPLPIIGKSAEAVAVDGARAGQWAGVESYDVARLVSGAATTRAGDLDAAWQSQWDDTNLYFFVSVADDTLVNDSDGWFYDDGIEIYIDAVNTKSFSYADLQYQITVERDNGDVIEDQKGNLGTGAVVSVVENGSGYDVEVALPWTALGVAPEPGLFLGLDVHAIDDDTGGAVDTKKTWFAEIDQSYQNPALFGTAYLQPDGDGDVDDPVGTDGTIASVTVPASFSPGETFPVTVEYTSTGTNDIFVRLESQGDYVLYATQEERRTVANGSGTITFDVTARDDVPLAADAYQVQTAIAPVGGDFSTRHANLTRVDLDCVADSGGGDVTGSIDLVIVPESFSPGETFPVSVDYTASGPADVYVLLESQGDYVLQAVKEERIAVTAGSGTLSFAVTAREDVPLATDAYQIQTVITTPGGGWEERLGFLTRVDLDCVEDSDGPVPIGEVGSSSANGSWTRVVLANTYDDPVVVMGALPMYGAQGAVPRVRNVSSNSFEWRVDEWEYLDGTHNREFVDYMVVEAGRHTLANGRSIEAGNTALGTAFTTVPLSPDLASGAVVFPSVNTVNEDQAVNVRVRGVTEYSFQMKLQEEENGGTLDGDRAHASETVGWIAVATGVTAGDGIDRSEAAATPNAVTQANYAIDFAQAYASDTRALFAHSQTYDGADAGITRYRQGAYTATGVRVFFQEEQSRDTEVKHTSEVVGYLILDGSGDLFPKAESPPPSENIRDEVIYDDALTDQWFDFSYGGTSDLADPNAASGATAIRFEPSDPNEAGISTYSGIDRTGTDLNSVRFQARSAGGAFTASVRYRSDLDTKGPWVDVPIGTSYGEVVASAVDLGSPTVVRVVDIRVPFGEVIYVDDLRLAYDEAPAAYSAPQPSSGGVVSLARADEAATLTVSPNPNDGRFRVLYELSAERGDLRLQLLDATGRLLEERGVAGVPGLNQLDFTPAEALPSGMYFVRLGSADGVVDLNRKVSVRR